MAEQKFDRVTLVPKICLRLAAGEPLAVICRDLDLNIRTVNHWRKEDQGIADQFNDARDLGHDAIAAECICIADDGRRDYTKDKDGREVVDHDHIQRAKLRIDTRLKLLSKWDPRRYGDKLITENTNHTTVEVVDTDEMDRRLDRAIAAACASTGAVEPES